MSKANNNLVCGKQVQVALNGVGHCWRNVGADEIPAVAREEIACEIIDGNDECDGYTATNGITYRW